MSTSLSPTHLHLYLCSTPSLPVLLSTFFISWAIPLFANLFHWILPCTSLFHFEVSLSFFLCPDDIPNTLLAVCLSTIAVVLFFSHFITSLLPRACLNFSLSKKFFLFQFPPFNPCLWLHSLPHLNLQSHPTDYHPMLPSYILHYHNCLAFSYHFQTEPSA